MDTEIVFESDMKDLPSDKSGLEIEPEWFPGDLPFFVGDIPGEFQMPPEDYHRIQAYSHTFGSTLLKNQPHWKSAFNAIDTKATDPLHFGSAYEIYFEHLYRTISDGKFTSFPEMDFRIDEINSKVAVMPHWEGTGSRKKADEFKALNEGKNIINEVQFNIAMLMLKSALSNKEFPHYLNQGTWQTVLLWIENGLPCKAMIDHLGRNAYSKFKLQAGDLKTAKQASYLGFTDSMKTYYYDHQASHYISGLKHVYNEDPAPFAWYVCEKEYPYGNAIYKASPEIMSAGDSARSASMDICKQLHDKGEIAEFPCYTSDGEHGAYDVSFNEKVLNQRFKLSMKWDYA